VRPLVLASASPARLRLLQEAGFDPVVIVSDVDEDAVTAPDTSELVRLLAEAKAAAVLDRAPEGALVLGCDSLLHFAGETYGKPATRSGSPVAT
jgi:septum formation protein